MIPFNKPLQIIGPMAVYGSTTTGLDSAANWLACGFVAKAANFDGFWFAVNRYGTDANIIIRCELQAENSATNLPSGTALAAVDVQGGYTTSVYRKIVLTYSGLAPGSRYYIVFKNLSALPATDFISVLHMISNMGGNYDNSGTHGLVRRTTINSGSTWPSIIGGYTGVYPIYGGVIDNIGLIRETSSASDNAVSEQIVPGISIGGDFVTPNRTVPLAAFCFQLRKQSTFTADVSAHVYINRSKVATSHPIPAYGIASSGFPYTFFFPELVMLPPKANVQIMIESSAGSAGSQYFYTSVLHTINPANADLYHLKPFLGTLRKAKLSSGVWTMTDNQYHSMFGLMYPDDPQYSINRRKYNNQR